MASRSRWRPDSMQESHMLIMNEVLAPQTVHLAMLAPLDP
jgi:hypothetical protein